MTRKVLTTDLPAPSMTDVLRAFRKGFENWPATTARAVLSRYVPGADPVIHWNTRQGTSFETPRGDRAWWSALECFPFDSYRLQELRDRTVSTFLDVGANVGAFSLAVKERFPTARGVAVEPIPRTFHYLHQNLMRNGLTGIVTSCWGAVTPSGESVQFVYDPRDSVRARAIDIGEDAAGHRVVVPSLRLHDLAKDFRQGIDLIKIDIEGGEYDLVGDLRKLVRTVHVSRLIIEYHDVPGHCITDLVSALAGGPMEASRIDRSSTAAVGLVFFDRAM